MEPNDLEQAAEQSRQQASDSFVAACNEARLCVAPDSLYLKWAKAQEIFKRKRLLKIKMLPVSEGVLDSKRTFRQFNFSVKVNSAIRLDLKRRREKSLFSPLVNWFNDQMQS